MKIYENVQEAETAIRRNMPPILYKYRDWSNLYHQQLLTEHTLWLAAPKELNDPHDIRVPLNFNPEEVDHPLFMEKLREQQKVINPLLNPSSREFYTLCENQLDIIKANPIKWFQSNYAAIRESSIYDCFGVLSLTNQPLQATMWAHYTGTSARGFCIGWDTVELARTLSDCALYKVHYQQEPLIHSFLTISLEQEILKQCTKNLKWSYEEEYRFVTPCIEHPSDRIKNFPPSSVREIFLDGRMPREHRVKIIDILTQQYGSQVTLYVIQQSSSQYEFQKQLITY